MECIDVVEGLSQKEQNKILSVLQRDANLRIGQEKKINDLKKEIQKLRMVGVLRAGDNQDKMCIRCRGDFGFLFNRGTLCPLCRFKVCNSCQQVMFNGSWLCIMCYKQRQLKWLTGEWKSFDQNPLRKWASGTDLVRASFQLVAGGSIDIDEDPDHGSSNNNQTRKPARNGVPVHDTSSKSRVEYPKDGDQHKLSQLFGVLRSKKSADDITPEHQIKRVSSRRYSESDSDSSSCSDGDVASSIRSSESPNALSMTESELDARRLDSPRGVDSPSPRGHGVNGSRSSDFQNTLSPADREYRPKAAPRSPKPQRRPSQNEAYILDSSKVVRPKTRPPRKPDRLSAPEGQVSGRDNVNVEDDSKVIMSKSMDVNLGGEQQSVEGELERKAVSQTELNLQRHVAKTKESLDRKKQEKQKSKSQNNIDNLTKNKSELEVEGNKLFRRSAENIIEHLPRHSDMSSVAKQTRKSDNQLDLKDNSNFMNQNTFKTEAEITNQRKNSKEIISSLYSTDSELDANGNSKDVSKMTNDDIVSNTKHAKENSQSKQNIQSKEDEGLFAFPAPRSGSPYSFSMDSLPSSHPSPTMRHSSIVSDSSIPESSDTDSLSRLSHPELGHLSEYSETESNIPDGAEDEFTVEEISNVRFQRVSKKVAQLGVMSKINKSPNRNEDVAVGQGETQSRVGLGSIEEGGHKVKHSHMTKLQPSESLHESVLRKQLHERNEQIILTKDKKTEPNDDQETVEDELFVREEFSEQEVARPSTTETVKDMLLKKFKLLDREKEAYEGRSKSVTELSWEEYSIIETPNKNPKELGQMKKHLRLVTSSVNSDHERKYSDSDSIEGLIDNMEKEEIKRYSENAPNYERTSEADSDASFNLTPITPMADEFFKVRTSAKNYRFAYMSDDNLDSADDILVADSEPDETVFEEKEVPKKPKLTSMGSLDLLIFEQGDFVDGTDENVELEMEFQEALKTQREEFEDAIKSKEEEFDTKSSVQKSGNTSSTTTGSSKMPISNTSNVSNANNETAANISIAERISIFQQALHHDAHFQKADNETHTPKSPTDKTPSHIDKTTIENTKVIHTYSPKLDKDCVTDQDNAPLLSPAPVVEETITFKTKPKLEAKSSLDILLDQQNVDKAPNLSPEPVVEETITFRTKPKLQAKSSLDILLDQQDVDIDKTAEIVDLDTELIAALEQEFRESILAKDKEYRKQESYTNKELAFLGVQHNVKAPATTVQSSLYKVETDLCHEKEASTELNDGKERELETNDKNTDVNFMEVKRKPIPVGYVLQHSSSESSDSDMLSVIDEEDETVESPVRVKLFVKETDDTTEKKVKLDKDLYDQLKSKQASYGIVSIDKKTTSNIAISKDSDVAVKNDVDESNSHHLYEHEDKSITKNATQVKHESSKPAHIKGKIFVKARDIEKRIKNLTHGGGSSRAISGKKSETKSNEKNKIIHDHWLAVEKHEADILDVEDEENQVIEDGSETNIDTQNTVAAYKPYYTETLCNIDKMMHDEAELSFEEHLNISLAKTKPLPQNDEVDLDKISEPKPNNEHDNEIMEEIVVKEERKQTESIVAIAKIHSLNRIPEKHASQSIANQKTKSPFGKTKNETSTEDENIVDLKSSSSYEKEENEIVEEKLVMQQRNPTENLPKDIMLDSFHEDTPESPMSREIKAAMERELANEDDSTDSKEKFLFQNVDYNQDEHNHGLEFDIQLVAKDLNINSDDEIFKPKEEHSNSVGSVEDDINNSPVVEFRTIRGRETKDTYNAKEIVLNSTMNEESKYNLGISISDNISCQSISESTEDKGSFQSSPHGQDGNLPRPRISISEVNPLCQTIKEQFSPTESADKAFTSRLSISDDNPLCKTISERDSYSDSLQLDISSSSNLGISISDNVGICGSIYERDSRTSKKGDVSKVSNKDAMLGDHKKVKVCKSIADGNPVLYYNVHEEEEACHSIDENIGAAIRGEKLYVSQGKTVDDVFGDSIVQMKGKQTAEGTDNADGKVKNEADDSENNSSVGSDQEHKPLTRLSHLRKNIDAVSMLPVTSPLFKTEVELKLEKGGKLTPPLAQQIDPEFFKAPVAPPRTKRRTPSSSAPSSPEIESIFTHGHVDSPRSEKLLANRESPQTISECSISQDDSGNVSGGSRGTTPEHKRTDSSYSQSSIPSTLSTVTDKSEEEEDIDKVVKLHTQYGSRGNLLSVITDSRESIASYYSDAGDIAYSNIPVTGEILFAVKYNYKTAMLEVTVKQCKDIAIADTRRNKTDPYVKTYLLPDKTRNGKRKTKVKKHTTSPTFEETLRYSISKSELENRTLWVTVWHNDRFGRNSFLGEVTINFDYYKFDDTTSKWYILQERVDSQPSSMLIYKGDISVCIRYVTADKVNTSPTNKGKQKKDSGARGQLEVMVKEARNLTAVRSNGFSDPFCKGYLLPERHKSSKQKTAVIKKDCNPVWNHTFVFEDVSLMELRERCLELTIWDYEKISSNDFLGGVRLNLGTGMSQGKATEWMDARGEEMSMWQAMLDRPNLWIDGALILRPNMEKRKY